MKVTILAQKTFCWPRAFVNAVLLFFHYTGHAAKVFTRLGSARFPKTPLKRSQHFIEHRGTFVEGVTSDVESATWLNFFNVQNFRGSNARQASVMTQYFWRSQSKILKCSSSTYTLRFLFSLAFFPFDNSCSMICCFRSHDSIPGPSYSSSEACSPSRFSRNITSSVSTLSMPADSMLSLRFAIMI